MPQFVRDVEEIRQRATNKIEEGAVTNAYKGDVEKTISILNEALATEIVCVLRYMHHYFMATGVHGKSVADEFKEHADAERGHADMIGERIQQLGGKPDFNPKSLLERSVSQYIEGETLAEMIREDLIAERIVIEVYQGMIRHFADNDPTTRVMLEQILKDEEEHASDLADLLYIVDPETGRTEGEDPGTNPLKRQHGQRQPASGDGHARVESNGGTRSPQSARMQAEPPAQRRQSSIKQQGTQEPPDFYPTSDVDEELKRKKALKAGTSGTLVEKRQASREAGSPGAPEFSATARHVLTKQRPGTERKPEKGSKAASPTRKRKIA